MPRFKRGPTTEEKQHSDALPFDRVCACYYRQSTGQQVGNLSTSEQLQDLPRYVRDRLGWPEDKVITIDSDEGISGTTRADQRPGLSRLYSLIEAGEIGAIAVAKMDRLFRDQSLIGPTVLFDLCKRHDVRIIVYHGATYDFNGPQGRMNFKTAMLEAEYSAEYLHIAVERMHSLKRASHEEGFWTGEGVPTGYCVKLSKDRKHARDVLVPLPEIAEIARQYFALFEAHSYNMRRTAKHVAQHGPYLPEYEDIKVPEGHKLPRLRNYTRAPNDRLAPSRWALQLMLQNPTYIGIKIVSRYRYEYNDQGKRRRKELISTQVLPSTHEGIVDPDLFWRCFNHLSNVLTAGTPNPNYVAPGNAGRQAHKRPSGIERPITDGLLRWIDDDTGTERRVIITAQRGRYSYVASTVNTSEFIWSKSASAIDERIWALASQRLRDAIALYQDYDAKVEAIATARTEAEAIERACAAQLADGEFARLQALKRLFPEDVKEQKRLVAEEIAATKKRLAGIERKIDGLADVGPLFDKYKSDYIRVSAELERLKDKQATLNEADQRYESFKALIDDLYRRTRDLDSATQQEKRDLLASLIDKIIATRLDTGDMSLYIHWHDGSTRELVMGNAASIWTSDKKQRLIALVDSGAPLQKIMEAYPDMTYSALYGQARYLTGKGIAKSLPIGKSETWRKYSERIKVSATESRQATHLR